MVARHPERATISMRDGARRGSRNESATMPGISATARNPNFSHAATRERLRRPCQPVFADPERPRVPARGENRLRAGQTWLPDRRGPSTRLLRKAALNIWKAAPREAMLTPSSSADFGVRTPLRQYPERLPKIRLQGLKFRCHLRQYMMQKTMASDTHGSAPRVSRPRQKSTGQRPTHVRHGVVGFAVAISMITYIDRVALSNSRHQVAAALHLNDRRWDLSSAPLRWLMRCSRYPAASWETAWGRGMC